MMKSVLTPRSTLHARRACAGATGEISVGGGVGELAGALGECAVCRQFRVSGAAARPRARAVYLLDVCRQCRVRPNAKRILLYTINS